MFATVPVQGHFTGKKSDWLKNCKRERIFVKIADSERLSRGPTGKS
jgi:hypothetical protein